MKLTVLAGLLVVTVIASGSAVAALSGKTSPASRVLLSHAFHVGTGAAVPVGVDATTDVEFVLEERRGEVRKGGPSGRELFDGTDYSGVAELTVHRDLLLGPSDPAILLPAGTYSCDLLPAGPGLLRLMLHGAAGLRLSIPLLSAPDDSDAKQGEPPPATTSRATAMAFEQPGDAWVVGLRLPTAAGAFVLTPAGAPSPSRSRSEVIRRELRDRLMHGTRPVRRLPR